MIARTAPPPPTPPPRQVVQRLIDDARQQYFAARRLLRIGTHEALTEAHTAFLAVEQQAKNNPLAVAGMLEALALLRLAGSEEVEERLLMGAAARAHPAWRDQPRHVATNRALGAFYLATGDLAQAASFLEGALVRQPPDPESLLLRGLLRLRNPEQREAGLADLREAIQRDPDWAPGRRSLIEAVGADSAEGRRHAQALASIERSDAEAWQAIRNGTFAPGEEERARLFPDDVEAIIGRIATAPGDSGEEPAAGTPSSAAVSGAKSGAQEIARRPEPDPRRSDRPKARAKAAQVAPPISTPQTATEVGTEPATQATETPPSTPEATPTPTPLPRVLAANAEDHYLAGMSLLQSGSLLEAIAELQEAVRLSPRTARYHAGLGWAYYTTGKLDLAVQSLDLAVQIAPRSADSHKMIAFVFERLRRYTEACVHLENYTRLAPHAADAAAIELRRYRLCGR